MKNIGKSYSFLISALLSMFSFIFAIAIALMLFANAKEQSYLSSNRTIALTIARNIMEEQKNILAKSDIEFIEELCRNPKTSEEKIVQYWDEEERTFSARVALSGEKKAQSALLHIHVRIEGSGLDGEEELLVSLDTDKYIALQRDLWKK